MSHRPQIAQTAQIRQPQMRRSGSSQNQTIPNRAIAQSQIINNRQSPDPSITSAQAYQPRICANINGATMVASDSMTNFGVSIASFSHVIFSFGDAPEYEP